MGLGKWLRRSTGKRVKFGDMHTVEIQLGVNKQGPKIDPPDRTDRFRSTSSSLRLQDRTLNAAVQSLPPATSHEHDASTPQVTDEDHGTRTRRGEEMSLRKSVNGRPSGTDGSDFSYRMVVDSRYQKVAEGKSRLGKLIFIQGFIQFLAAVVVYLSTLEGGTLDRLSASSCVIFFISLLIGELGRKRSRAILLKLYLFGSSVAVIISVVSVLQSGKSLEVIKDLSRWASSKLEVSEIAVVSLGVVVQLFSLMVTTSLIHNMAPPKRAS
ncbi:hypothetical protein C2S52_006741 [Perilla frutescens var. hirtella]|nr:hypothetical protein C2S52_006741 [Perilla frutescens var. hirtella]